MSTADERYERLLKKVLRLSERCRFLEDWRRYKERSLAQLASTVDVAAKALTRAQRALDNAAERLHEGDAASKARARVCQESSRELGHTRSSLLQEANKVLTETQPIEVKGTDDDPN